MARGTHGASHGPLVAARTHRRSSEASARTGLQLALAALALAIEEFLCDFALVAARHRPVGAQFPLAPSPALAASSPAGGEVAQVAVIEAVVELLLRAHRLGWRRLGLSLGPRNGQVHRRAAWPPAWPPA